MNLAEIYAARLNQTLLIEVHMIGNIVQSVRVHTKPLNELIQDLIDFWAESGNYDSEEDDTQIWDINDKLLWSYHSYYEENDEDDE